MASAPLLDAAKDTTAIVVAVQQNPGVVLLDVEKFDVFYDKLKADAPTDVDISTKKGRDTLRSYASDVRSKKAAIDKARLQLTKEWRDMTAQANAAGKIIEERLEGLAAEVRKPLTDWEEAENARISKCRDTIARLKQAANVTILDTVATVRERGAEVYQTELDPETFGDMLEEAQAAREHSMAVLKEALARLTREEAERAELEKLRAEKAEAEAREAERIAVERAAQEAAERARAEQDRRAAAEKAEQERIAQLERDAAEKARRAAEEEAQAKLNEERRAREAAEAEARRVTEQAERAAQAERDRLAAEQAEQAKRDADQKHKSAVMKAAKEAIMTCGMDEETAKKVVLLIIAKQVPNVELRF